MYTRASEICCLVRFHLEHLCYNHGELGLHIQPRFLYKNELGDYRKTWGKLTSRTLWNYALHLNHYNFSKINAIDILFSILYHTDKIYFGLLYSLALLQSSINMKFKTMIFFYLKRLFCSVSEFLFYPLQRYSWTKSKYMCMYMYIFLLHSCQLYRVHRAGYGLLTSLAQIEWHIRS